jgi:peptidoglycan hydrolase CwlO-like protein
MSERGTTRTVNALGALSLVMGLLAVTGWGTFAYAAKSSAAAHHQLTEQVGELKVSQGQLFAERDQAKAEVADLKARRDQLGAELVDAQAQLAVAREEVVMLQKQVEHLQAKASATGSVRASAPSGNPARSPTQTRRTRR